MLPQALLLVVLLNTNVASTSNIITALPGFPGSLPFKLETGMLQWCGWGLEEVRRTGRWERERERERERVNRKYGAHKDHVIKLTENLMVLVWRD
ncbi:hypothetical protein DVH24_007790 [Malus domestica]|uniref:Secreted protein n=1 Tax=Malus domestica TaxID=3750 RepID=A0A498JUF4_MALDO|nr:hypothetical protein DVH24_007790 [Malus domestica]